MPTNKVEGKRAGEHLLSEGNGNISRDVVSLTGAASFSAGTVLGRITATGKYTLHDSEASDGTQNAIAILHEYVDVTSADEMARINVRNCEVAGDRLTYKSGITDPDKAAAISFLSQSGIIVR